MNNSDKNGNAKRVQGKIRWVPFPFLKILKPSTNKIINNLRYIFWLIYRFFTKKPRLIAKINKSLIVLDKKSAEIAYDQGAFGKATMSRGEQTWFARYYLGQKPNGLTEKRLLDAFDKDEHEWYALRRDPELFVLMPVETFFLAYGLGVLQLKDGDKDLSVKEMWAYFSSKNPGFPTRYAVYHFFRTKGWTPKSGLASGFEFVLYKKGPRYRHADYCVWIIPRTESFRTRELNAKVRIANTLKKVTGIDLLQKLLICFVDIPNDTASLDCISKFEIRAIIVSRWLPDQHAIDKMIAV
jgi:tRNA-splicing endonuclease subunit Sen2